VVEEYTYHWVVRGFLVSHRPFYTHYNGMMKEELMNRYFFATLLSLYNKWMFSPQYYGFSFPLFVTFCHMIVQFCLAGVMRIVWAKRYRPVERPTRRDYV